MIQPGIATISSKLRTNSWNFQSALNVWRPSCVSVAAERTMKLSSGILGVSVAAMSLTLGLEGLRRFERSLAGQQLAAAPSPVLTVLGASAVLVLGSWLCVALLRHRWARFSLILAWCGAALLVAVLGHLNHAAIAAPCREQAAVQEPLNRRCTELQQRGRL